MDRLNETPIDVLHEPTNLYPAVYINNISNRELYGWLIFELRGKIPVADPQNLSKDFEARLSDIDIDDVLARGPAQCVIPPEEPERLKDVVKEQLDCYYELKEDKFPLWFHSSQIQHVVYNPKDKPGITKPWRGKYDDGSRVLSKQLRLWKWFRLWQSRRRLHQENVFVLERESGARLENLGIGSYRWSLTLQPNPSEQSEATTLLEYLDFIDVFYAPSRGLVQTWQTDLDGACDCEQAVSTKRGRRSKKKGKGRAAGPSTGRARVDECECKRDAAANLEDARRMLDLRNANWDETVKQLHKYKPDALEDLYPLAPLQTEIQTEGAGSAVLQTRPAQDSDVEIVEIRPRRQVARRGRPRGSWSDEGPAYPYPPVHLRRSPRNFVATGLTRGPR